MFFQWNFSWSMGQFFGSAVNIPYKKSEELRLACLFEVFTGLWLSKTTFFIKGCIGFISDKYRVSKKILKKL